MEKFNAQQDAENYISWLKNIRDNISIVMSKINEKEKLSEHNEEFLEMMFPYYYDAAPEAS
jgi:hypothetical protein